MCADSVTTAPFTLGFGRRHSAAGAGLALGPDHLAGVGIDIRQAVLPATGQGSSCQLAHLLHRRQLLPQGQPALHLQLRALRILERATAPIHRRIFVRRRIHSRSKRSICRSISTSMRPWGRAPKSAASFSFARAAGSRCSRYGGSRTVAGRWPCRGVKRSGRDGSKMNLMRGSFTAKWSEP